MQVEHASSPDSMSALRRKIGGDRLERADYLAIMRDVAQHRYSKLELAAFVVATGHFDLDREEVVYLTEAMVAAGRRLDWYERPVVDKHSIGGIPGNRTSMLIVPIVAAHGMLIPKTSSRAITSPAGTADTMECLANVELTFERMRRSCASMRGCLAWGGTADLSPADDALIAVERPLSLDSPGQMVASILSKKIAAGSTHLLLDLPLGPSAKVRSMPEAQRLRKLFEYVAERLDLTLDVVITDGRQPVGNGIGPSLEARDVMRVLSGDPRAPADLRQKALRLAGRVIEFDPDVRGGEGFPIARDILDSGRALAKMHAIIDAQGRRDFDPDRPDLAPHSFRGRSATRWHRQRNRQRAPGATGAPDRGAEGARCGLGPVQETGRGRASRRTAVPCACGVCLQPAIRPLVGRTGQRLRHRRDCGGAKRGGILMSLIKENRPAPSRPPGDH